MSTTDQQTNQSQSVPAELVIQLNVQADIVVAIEALRFYQAQKVGLVLPASVSAFRKFFNLRLLKQISLIVKQDFVLITTDQGVIDLAQYLEIATAKKITDVFSDEVQIITTTLVFPIDSTTKIKSQVQTEITPVKSVPKPLTVLPESTPKMTPPPADKPLSDAPPVVIEASKVKPQKISQPLKTLPKATPPNFSSAPQPASVPRSNLRVKKASLKNLLLFFGLGLFLVVGALAVYFFVSYSYEAIINIQTDLSEVRVNIQADLIQDSATVNLQNQSLPLIMVSLEREYKINVATTDYTSGVKASGVIEVYNCHPTQALVIDAQTVFRRDDKDFIIQDRNASLTIPPSAEAENCEGSVAAVNKRSLRIEALAVGEDYNSPETRSYQIVGLDEADYNIIGFFIDGGQASTPCSLEEDLELAREQLQYQRNDTEAIQTLIERLKATNLIALEETFQLAEAEIVNPEICPSATDNEVSQVIIYYLGGIKSEDLEILIRPLVEAEAEDLMITDYGLATADIEVYNRYHSQQPQPTIQAPARLDYYIIIDITQATATINLDQADILETIIGRRAKQVGADLRHRDGVKMVDIQFSPAWAFWISDLPSDKQKITLNIDNQPAEVDVN